MTDFDKWVNIVSKDESDLIKMVKCRYIELADKYCPDLDEQGKKYLTECEIPFILANPFKGLSWIDDLLTDDELAKQELSNAILRYNGLTGKDFKVEE